MCSMLLLALSALLFAFCAYTVTQLVQYTPVYRPVVCTQRRGYSDVSSDAMWTNITAHVQKDCLNPNNYALGARADHEDGEVFVRADGALKLAGVSRQRPMVMAEHGGGTVETTVLMSLPWGDASIQTLLQQGVVQACPPLARVATCVHRTMGV